MPQHLQESDLVIDEDVIVIKKGHEHERQTGQIWKINRYTSPPTVSVHFDGNVYRFKLEDLILA